MREIKVEQTIWQEKEWVTLIFKKNIKGKEIIFKRVLLYPQEIEKLIIDLQNIKNI